MPPTSEHWDKIFSNTDDINLGWYEDDVSHTLKLLKLIPEWEHSNMFLVGAGTSILIDTVLDEGVHLTLNDISAAALNRVKSRLGKKSEPINWLQQDISEPIGKKNQSESSIDIWVDRAVLHFLTDKKRIKGYFDNLKTVLKKGGYVLFAEFSKAGALKCAGLELHRYSVDELTECLGPAFQLVNHFDHVYLNPTGDSRPYLYCLYQKTI